MVMTTPVSPRCGKLLAHKCVREKVICPAYDCMATTRHMAIKSEQDRKTHKPPTNTDKVNLPFDNNKSTEMTSNGKIRVGPHESRSHTEGPNLYPKSRSHDTSDPGERPGRDIDQPDP
jgi:hypothetical protein